MQIIIRKGTLDDMGDVLKLVRELAFFEKEPEAVITSVTDYQNLFRENLYFLLLAEHEKSIVGIAIYYNTFSTWKGKMMYLEDLIVTQEYRNRGIGQKLFDAFLVDSKKRGAKLVKWQVLNWNQHAIRFYLRNNAKIDKDWLNGIIYFNS
jgi:ribosomal protein S18 acetylase RimI-like enzyme